MKLSGSRYWGLYLAWALLCASLGLTFREEPYTVERLRHQEIEELAKRRLRALDEKFSEHVVINSAYTDTESADGSSRWVILLNRPGTHDFDEAVVLELSLDGQSLLKMRKPSFQWRDR